MSEEDARRRTRNSFQIDLRKAGSEAAFDEVAVVVIGVGRVGRFYIEGGPFTSLGARDAVNKVRRVSTGRPGDSYRLRHAVLTSSQFAVYGLPKISWTGGRPN